MPQIFKVLGQSNPTANTNTDVYTVPASNSAVVSTITVCNANINANVNYSIAVRPSGATLAQKHYVTANAVVGFLDTIVLTSGLTLSNGDVITVFTSGSTVSFNVFGSEIY
jgi:hypothetical protein